MPLYAERSDAHLTVATDYNVSFSSCSKRKDADLGKCTATELLLVLLSNFCMGFIGLSARNVDHGAGGDKITRK